ncbi:MAG: peptide-methionine (S)-S-oxide reductase MsrA [Hyphomicrobiales bacterium]
MALLSRRTALGLSLAALAGLAVASTANSQSSPTPELADNGITATQTAIFAGGCFWCVEKDFDHVEGVLETTSGYIGGRLPNPTYQTHVGSGDREAVEITFDPSVVTYEELAHSFFRTVDPLDDGGQFCDRGHSYTTAIYVLDDDQRAIAEAAAANASDALGETVATEILDAPRFWPAEDYHQNYYQENPLRYQFYRASCRRDSTVERRWGEDAYAGVNH